MDRKHMRYGFCNQMWFWYFSNFEFIIENIMKCIGSNDTGGNVYGVLWNYSHSRWFDVSWNRKNSPHICACDDRENACSLRLWAGEEAYEKMRRLESRLWWEWENACSLWLWVWEDSLESRDHNLKSIGRHHSHTLISYQHSHPLMASQIGWIQPA